MSTTLAAYVYDAVSGLALRTVVSDDYPSPQAMIAAHCAPGEAAVVTQYTGTFDENRIAMAIARVSDEEVQAIVAAHSKIEPPPLLKYALTGPTGKVFETIETRNPEDGRLKRHAAFEAISQVPPAELTDALALVATAPDLDLLQPKVITPELVAAHDLVYAAKMFGLVDDGAARLDPTVSGQVAEKQTGATFGVHEAAGVDKGDVLVGGLVAKLVVGPVPADLPVVGDTRLVL